MIPAHFASLAELPLTANGKVDRNALPAPDLEAVARERGSTWLRARRPSPASRRSGANALGIASPSVDDNFFDLGGHSMKAAQIVTALRSALEVDVAMRHLFEQPTVAGLAKIVDLIAVSAEGPERADGSAREEVEI